MHARQQILAAVAGLLDAAVAPPWKGVYVSSVAPGVASLPCALVSQVSEPAGPVPDSGFLDGSRQWRTLTLSVLYLERARANAEDTTAALNAAAAAIETAVTLTAMQGALANVKNGALQGTEIDEAPDESGFVGISVSFSFEYMTAEGAPETLIA